MMCPDDLPPFAPDSLPAESPLHTPTQFEDLGARESSMCAHNLQHRLCRRITSACHKPRDVLVEVSPDGSPDGTSCVEAIPSCAAALCPSPSAAWPSPAVPRRRSASLGAGPSRKAFGLGPGVQCCCLPEENLWSLCDICLQTWSTVTLTGSEASSSCFMASSDRRFLATHIVWSISCTAVSLTIRFSTMKEQ